MIRRNNTHFMTSLEMKITELMREVEEMGAHHELSNAVGYLEDARDAIANYVDEKLAE